eukprot:3377723-Pleurochrysis_carterae.AAC.4
MVRQAQKSGQNALPDSGQFHLIKSLSSASAGLKPCTKIRVTSTLISQNTELHDQPTSPRTQTSCAPSFPSRHSTETLYSVPTALFRTAKRKSTAETTSILKPGAFRPAL